MQSINIVGKKKKKISIEGQNQNNKEQSAHKVLLQ